MHWRQRNRSNSPDAYIAERSNAEPFAEVRDEVPICNLPLERARKLIRRYGPSRQSKALPQRFSHSYFGFVAELFECWSQQRRDQA
jgi:hypothetical protein